MHTHSMMADNTMYTEHPESQTTTPYIQEESSVWTVVWDVCDLSLSIIGLLANILAIIVFSKKKSCFARIICILLLHQSILDGLICLLAIPILVQPSMWTSGVEWMDHVICHVWHTQIIYWIVFLMSVWNLCLLSVERFLAICQPFTHMKLTKKKIYCSLAVLYAINLLYNFIIFLDAIYKDGVCHLDYLSTLNSYQMIMKINKVLWSVFAYIIPLIFFVGLYSKIIYTLRQRESDITFGPSLVINKANIMLTKMAIAIVVIFLLALSMDSWLYFFSTINMVTYELNSEIQKLGVLLTTLNSAVNPFIYILTVPTFRQELKKLIVPMKNVGASASYSSTSQRTTNIETICDI